MNTKRFFIFLVLISMLAFGLWLPANAAPDLRQQIVTPTARPDGRIIYVAQPGDNCTRIAGLNGITVDQLRQLNSKLDQNCTIVVGQEYLVGVVSLEGTPTAGPSPTPAPPTPTPTPFTGTTEICVLLFNDINGNSLREATEPAVAGGAISVTENNGEYSAAQETFIPNDPAAYQGFCFMDVPEGSYNVTVGIPDNYNPTMELSASLEIKAGGRAFMNFGVQSKDVIVGTGGTQSPEGQARSPWLGVLGAIFLLGGAGLGYYAWRSGKPESKLSGGGNILKK